MKILKFRAFEKNTLQGFFELELPSGLCIRDLTYHRKDDARWIGYPSRPYQDDHGNTRYMNTIYFAEKDRHFKFQDALLKALDEYLATQAPAQVEDPAGEDADIPL